MIDRVDNFMDAWQRTLHELFVLAKSVAGGTVSRSISMPADFKHFHSASIRVAVAGSADQDVVYRLRFCALVGDDIKNQQKSRDVMMAVWISLWPTLDLLSVFDLSTNALALRRA